MLRTTQIAVALIASITAASAHASLLVEEQFDYSAGANQSVGTLNGGTGWSGSWAQHSSPGSTMDIVSGLTFGTLDVAGNSRIDVPDSRNGRTISGAAETAIGTQITNNDSIWISFIAVDGGTFAGNAGITFYDGGTGGTGGAEQMFIGSGDATQNGNWYVNPGTGDNEIGSGVSGGTLAFFVVELDYSGANTDINVELFTGGNLASATTSETYSFTGDLAFDTIRLTRDLNIDEFRVGMSRADVTPTTSSTIPVPAALPAGLAMLALVASRRRRA